MHTHTPSTVTVCLNTAALEKFPLLSAYTMWSASNLTVADMARVTLGRAHVIPHGLERGARV